MPDTFDRLKQALADRYAIEREIGAGGMATVYVAEDLKLHRRVAIKVLRPELAVALGTERFVQEIELTAKLQHPQILPLYEAGEAEGFLYYVMPFVEGHTLRERLDRDGKLSVEDAVRLTDDIAAALSYAHDHGIVHRDVKPENIMLTGGRAVVADFGIARAVSAAGGERLTGTGLAIGTPAYMSPEQAMGLEDVDARSDVYSLGCVVYEMVGGRAPFEGTTPQALLAKHAADTVPGLRTSDPAIPVFVERAVEKALAKRPSERFQSVGELVEVLGSGTVVRVVHRPWRRSLAGAGVLVALLVLAGGWWLFAGRGGAGTDQPGERIWIAVLPFENLSASEDDEYFSEGVTQDINTQLSQIEGFVVIAHGSARRAGSTEMSHSEAARELGVRYLVDGSVSRLADRVHITARLIDPETSEQLWADDYDRQLSVSNIFAVRGEVARQIAAGLNVTLSPVEREEIGERPTESTEAYDFYLRGNDYFNRGLGDPEIIIAARMYERAIALDSTFSLAYAALAKAHARTAFQGRGPTGEQSRIAAERALELAPELAQAHEALGWYHYWVSWDPESALDHFIAARRKLPNSSDVIAGLGLTKRRVGRWQEALEDLEEAFALDPLSTERAIEVGTSYLLARKYVEAVDYFSRAVAIAPDQHRGYAVLATALVARDNALDGAVRVLREGAVAIGEREFVKRLLGPNTTPEIRWLLPELFSETSRRLSSEDLGSRTVRYYVMMAGHHARYGQTDTQRAYGDSAVFFFDGLFGVLAHAHSGNREEVLRRVPLFVERWSDDPRLIAQRIHRAARAYLIVGEYEAALERLEAFASKPSAFSLAMLRFNPIWDPLRDHPRFQALLAKYEN